MCIEKIRTKRDRHRVENRLQRLRRRGVAVKQRKREGRR